MENPGVETTRFTQAFGDEALPRQLNHVLMSRPLRFSIPDESTSFSLQSPPVDPELATAQWNELVAAFGRAGVDAVVLDPVPGLGELCWTAQQGFAGADRDENCFVVPSRLLHRRRREEVEVATHWYASHGYRVLDLDLDVNPDGEEFLEGAADLLWNPDWESVWAGFGHRSTRGAVEQFALLMESMGFGVRKLELVDPRFCHLNLCLAPLGPESALLYPGAFAPDTLKQIRQTARCHEATREEALRFACSGVSVNGYYITPRLGQRLEQVVTREGLEPVTVDLSEFEKAGASVASLKMLLP